MPDSNPDRDTSPSLDVTNPVMHLRRLRTALIEMIHHARVEGWDISWNALDVFDTEMINISRRRRNRRISPESGSNNTENGESDVQRDVAMTEVPENEFGLESFSVPSNEDEMGELENDYGTEVVGVLSDEVGVRETLLCPDDGRLILTTEERALCNQSNREDMVRLLREDTRRYDRLREFLLGIEYGHRGLDFENPMHQERETQRRRGRDRDTEAIEPLTYRPVPLQNAPRSGAVSMYSSRRVT